MFRLRRRWLRLALPGAAFLAAGVAADQQEQSAPTFRAATKLVEVDVVARSKDGPATGLTQDDFTLLDNGKPRKISFFSVRSVRSPGAIPGPAAVPLPAGVVSNRSERNREKSAITTVILIDQKNTPQVVQGFAIQRIVKFLQMRRKGDRVGIYMFAKNGRLQAVQEITDDEELLSRAANSLKARDPRYRDLDIGGMTPHAADGFKALEFHERGQDTKVILEAIARHLANVPGRKSLIWVTTSFPLFVPDLAIDFRPDMEEAARLLNDANVALYAVDAHGIMGALSGLTAISNAEVRGPQSMAELRRQMSATGGRIPDPFDAPGAGVDTMNMLAGLTGGLVFYNQSNAIEESIQTAVDDGELIYTLGFYPMQEGQDGAVHNLKVEVARPGVSVRYRENYLASGTTANDHPTLEQLLKDPLDATQLELAAEITPDRQVRVTVDLHGVQLEKQDNLWVGAVDVSFMIEGSRSARTVTTTVKIPDKLLTGTLEKGIVVNDSIGADGRTGVLRIVVQDRVTGAVGSIRVPLGGR